MSFAETYLRRYATKRVEELPDPDPDLYYSVVIPVFSEPNLIDSLNSLCNAEAPQKSWEILLVVNEPNNCSWKDHERNIKTIEQVGYFRDSLKRKDLKIHILRPDPFPRKKAGPGIARKIGMDEALRRYNRLDRPEGVIISFDADTQCSSDYLRELDSFYSSTPRAAGCTVNFEHLLDHEDIEGQEHRDAMAQYELYLRYFKMSLDWIGYPWSSFSLGSAFTIRAESYVKVGGMGQQQAGEDFYFLQKCLPHGNFWELNTTTVYPSPRISKRVIFGTGPFLATFLSEQKKELDVYPFEIFKSFKSLFVWINNLEEFPESIKPLANILDSFPTPVRESMLKLGWYKSIDLAHSESASLTSFRKRFYHEVNILLLIRLLNELTEDFYPKRNVTGQLMELLKERGLDAIYEEPLSLLEFLRKLNREPQKKEIGIKSG